MLSKKCKNNLQWWYYGSKKDYLDLEKRLLGSYVNSTLNMGRIRQTMFMLLLSDKSGSHKTRVVLIVGAVQDVTFGKRNLSLND